MVAIPLFSHSKGWDQWFIPSFVALLWGLSTASFITTFHTVPAADGSLRFFARLKRRFARAWYWFIGMAFLVTSLAVLFFTYKMVSIWIRTYSG